MKVSVDFLPLPRGIVAGALVVAMLSLSACSVFMAANQPPKKNLDVLRPGTPRALVVGELGQPVSSESKNGRRVDIFSFAQGYSTGAKASRAMFHAAADVMTAGLWEVVGTPTESAFRGKHMAFEVTYDDHDRVETALPPGAGTQISRLLISYSRADTAFVDLLEATLTAKSIRVARDPHDPETDSRPPERAALASTTVLLVLSENSVNDPWLRTETESILDLESEIARQIVYPLALDEAWNTNRSTKRLRTHTVIAFQHWEEPAAFDRACEDLLDTLSVVSKT